ncbi:MAG: pullulanase-type alpha-1,6-glucosidase [Thermoflexales bacterium]|nr:pullulanase-type alpha-1,6-glucosidase [Thermoflexales bacterium]
MLRRFVSASMLVALIVSVLPVNLLYAQDTPAPTKVVVPGTHQSELGCSGDWQPDCDKTALTYDAQSDVWTGEFEIQPDNAQDGSGQRYKVALNGSWSENYGQKAQPGGADIPLVVNAPTKVKFYYDHKTHWVADSFNTLIVTAIGDFQSELGCAKDNDAACLRSWLQDPEGDGQYAFITTKIPAGNYELRMALNEQTTEVYGQDGQKDGAAIPFTVAKDGDEVYFGFDGATKTIAISTDGAPRGSLGAAMAHWLTSDTLVWNVIGSPKYSYALHYDPTGALTLGAKGVEGGQTISLTFSSSGPGAAMVKKFPQLTGYSTLKLDAADVAKVPEILKGQIAVTARDQNGKLIDATSVQIPGVLDDLFAFDGPLGVTWAGDKPTLRVWAPTARSVKLHLYADATTTADTVISMVAAAQSGVWTAAGEAAWKNQFYLYEVEVYVRSTNQVERNLVTDPYSFSLATNSTRSQIVDLNEAALQPTDWTQLTKPVLNAPEDAVIYELHVRDFSSSDETVPAAERGTFKAFTELNSNGMQHLKRLAEAGLTHVHLLPAFDIATIEEDRAKREEPAAAQLASFAGDSDQQQAVLEPLRDKDGYNWGYDPYHYTVPEGSYATDPSGTPRIVEFREMVQALNQTGLRVVMDVVYNHTNASGQGAKSVLDKIVPGYYHRLNAKGEVETSTCCQNTATEHTMMEKLMIDSVVTWARDYKVDGFRFDLMGHHMLSNMVNVRAALDALTLDKDEVDGKAVYIYGEGWDFGEVAKNVRGQNATQLNIGGTGIGVFNDRLRDAARGGGPFAPLPEQGFITGLLETPNDYEQRTPAEQEARLIEYHDWIRAGLAGNLRDFPLQKANDDVVPAENIKYNGAPTAYTLDPQENINYVSAHDNETLFDAVQAKAPTNTVLADRIAMNNLGIDLVMLSQGVPFFHAGDDVLRSKSLDRNSYNSGDWFNRFDFTYQSNNWAVGLPPQGDNKDKWPIIQPLLANAALKPQQADILGALSHFETLLKIRQSSKLFRLETADQIKQHLSFLNTGPDQQLGLIVMRLSNNGPDRIADPYGEIVVLFNASAKEQAFTAEVLKNVPLELHPLLAASIKQASFEQGTFKVPARTTVVYVAGEQAQPTPVPAATVAPTQVPPTAVPPTVVPPTVQPAAQPAPAAADSPSSTLPIVAVIGVALAAIAGFLFMRRRK